MKSMTKHTLSDLQKLADTDEGREQIRVIVAELEGWKNVRMSRSRPFWADSEGIDTYNALCGAPPGEPKSLVQEIPSYTESRDAIAECEAGLRGRDVEWYQHHLERVVFKFTTDDDWSAELGVSARTKPWHASALHRCIALILTRQTKNP